MDYKGVQKALKNLAGHVPEAFAFIFDEAENQFIYLSHSMPLYEKTIRSMNDDMGFSDRLAITTDDIIQVDCKETHRIFFMKKLASNLYLGMCVNKNAKDIEQTRLAMHGNFSL